MQGADGISSEHNSPVTIDNRTLLVTPEYVFRAVSTGKAQRCGYSSLNMGAQAGLHRKL